MERSELQRQWELHRFDGRTSYASSVGKYKTVDRDFEELRGAGCASRVRADRFLGTVAKPSHDHEGPGDNHSGSGPSNNQREDILAADHVDWAGNLVPLNRRKTFVNDLRQRGNLAAQDGHIVAREESKMASARRRTGQYVNQTSEGVWQSSPGALDPSQWRTSSQDALGARDKVLNSGRSNAPPNQTSIGGITYQGPISGRNVPYGSNPLMETGSFQKPPKPTYDKEKGDFVKGLDTHSIAKSMRRQGIHLAGTSAAASSRAGDDVLILENYKVNMPGTTLHTHRHAR